MKRQNRMLLLVLMWMVACAAFGASRAGASISPYFQDFWVYAFNTSTEMKTALDAVVVDPDGFVPDTLSSVTVTGPNGFAYSFLPGDYQGGTSKDYYKSLSGLPADGEYTFTTTDIDGNTATTYFYLTVGETIPLPAPSTLQASGTDPLRPILSWSAIPGYPGNLFYSPRVYDMDGKRVWMSSPTFNVTSITVPSGVLVSGQSYKWRVDAFDDFSHRVTSNRAASTTIPLTITNTHPYFTSVAVFSTHNPNGSIMTGLQARGADPAGSISSVIITDPNEVEYTYTGSAVSCFTSSTTCNWGLPTPPAEGLYTFTATNADNNTAVSYFHLNSHTVPLVDSATMHASGNPLTPVLSWSAPATIDRPLYYVVFVRNAATQSTIWSGSTVQNAISVPQGKLVDGVSYEWQVAPNDSTDFNFSNRSFSGWKTLLVDNSSPYFWYANVLNRNQPTGDFTYLDASVRDADEDCPGILASLTVTGPGGFSYTFQPDDFYAPDKNYYHRIPGVPQEGLYTFTLTDNNGKSAVTYRYHRQREGTIPLLDEDSFQVFGDPLAPTISWSAVSGYAHDLFYSVQIVDQQDIQVYGSSTPLWPSTYQVVPSGRLVAGSTYRYRVNAFDGRTGAADNRSVSNYHNFGLPSISGRVTNGGAGITVKLAGKASQSTTTDLNGNYEFTELSNGAYTITPSKTGYTFIPKSISVNVNGANLTGQDFTFAGITVTSPNGGRSWKAGTTRTISWTYKGIPGDFVKIELLKGGLATLVKSGVSIGANGKGSWSWTIPKKKTPGTDYKIRVTSTTMGKCKDTSNKYFTITGPTIAVTSPNGGETWQAGTKHTISWSYTNNPGS